MGNIFTTSGPDPSASFRQQASYYAEQRNSCFQKSREAYEAGRHDDAKYYSQMGKENAKKMEECNRKAAQEIYEHLNNNRQDGHIDLHGLHVKEAMEYARREIEKAKQEKKPNLVFIVGKGRHSADGISRLKPAILQLINQYNLRCQPNVPNEGCVLVEFTTPEKRGWLDWMCVIC